MRLVAFCLGAAALSLIAPSAPTTDSWGWIVWGREIVHLQLSTVVPGAPSWKPFPVLVTTPLALAGGIAPTLWLLFARAGAIASVTLAGRLAARLGGPWAAALAVAGLLLGTNWVRSFAHGYSEPLAIGFLVLAVEQHLAGRARRALAFGALVALMRPEALVLLLGYGLVAGRRHEVSARFVLTLSVVVVALWTVPDWIGSGDPFHGGRVAAALVPAGPAATLAAAREVASIALWPLSLGAVAGVVLAVRRGEPAVAWLAATAAGWAAMLTVMMLLGYPAAARFFILPTALWCLAGAAGTASLVRAVPSGRARVATIGAMALLVVPVAALHARRSVEEAEDSVARARLEAQLASVVDRAGPAAVGTGEPMLPSRLAWMKGEVAWRLGLPLDDVRAVRTSAPGYLNRLDDPDDAPLPRAIRAAAVSVRASPRGELLLEPFGNDRIRVIGKPKPTVETVARAGRWRAVLVEPNA
jgi:hypothetical protein